MSDVSAMVIAVAIFFHAIVGALSTRDVESALSEIARAIKEKLH